MLPEGKVTVEHEGRYWNVVTYFENGGRAWSTFPEARSAHEAADVMRRKGVDYDQGGKEAGQIHDKAWDDVEPRLARLHAKHARAELAEVPASKAKLILPQIAHMKKAISNVEAQAKLGAKNAEQTRRAQAELFDVQFEIKKLLKA